MPLGDGPDTVPYEDAHLALEAGLKSCRTVVRNYRSLLAGNVGLDPISTEAEDSLIRPESAPSIEEEG